MPRNEGFVTTLNVDGKAEVIIQPVRSGIPGASPRMNRHVCHHATDGSTLTIEALNRVGAEVGDYVSVSRKTSGLVKNAAALVGIPGVSLMIGIILAIVIMHGFVFPTIGGTVIAVVFFLPGIALGVRIFRRVSADNPPVIERILKTRLEAGSGYDEDSVCLKTDSRTCQGCSGPFLTNQ